MTELPRSKEFVVIGDFMQAVRRDLAPSGTIRAALNFGNPVLARRDDTGSSCGLAVELTEMLAAQLSLPCELICYDSAVAAVEAGLAGAWDLAFVSDEPTRREQLHLTHPYVVLESTYLVRSESHFRTAVDLDREGVRIAVGQGGFYDRHLMRTLHHAQLVRAPTFQAAVETFLDDGLDAVAGLRQPLADLADQRPGLHVIEGRFAAVGQVIAVPKGRLAGLRYLNTFVEQVKASGMVGASLRRTADMGRLGPSGRPDRPGR